jgi:hypothetical protein
VLHLPPNVHVDRDGDRPVVRPPPLEEAVVEHDADHSAALGDRLDHGVAEMTHRGSHGPRVGMRGADSRKPELEAFPDPLLGQVGDIPRKTQVCHLGQQGDSLVGQSSGGVVGTAASHARAVTGVAEREPDDSQAATPPRRQIIDLDDGVGSLHEQHQTGSAVVVPEVEMVLEVAHRHD